MANDSNKLILTYPWDNPNSQSDPLYQVESVVGSVIYTPGQMLTKAEVKDLCEFRGQWVVTMKGVK